MSLNSFSSNQGTQTNLLTDNTGGTAGTLIPVMKIDYSSQGTAGTLFTGTILSVNTLGTLPNLPQGSINVTAGTVIVTNGTVGAGTLNLGTVTGKDANAAAQTSQPVAIGGTDSGGTVRTALVNVSGAWNIGTLNNGTVVIPSGTITTGSLTDIAMLHGGTLNTGTINTGTFVGNGGSIGVQGMAGSAVAVSGNPVYIAGQGGNGTAYPILTDVKGQLQIGAGTLGTVTGIGVVTTVTNLSGGTIGILTNGTLSSSGTTTGVGSVSNLGSLAMLTAGTLSMINAGTLTSLGTLPGVGVVSALTAGTLSPIPTIANVTYGTHGTTGASVFGTLAGGTGSGAGTEIFCTSVSLSVPSTGGSQDVSIGWGTNGGTFHAGTGLIVRGNFPPGGGIQKTFWPPINSGTQAQLMMFQAGAGTVDVSISYFLAVSSL